MPSIEDLLRSRYPAKTHALMFEVRNDAGFHANRSCDAIALGLWPSRGLKLAGFEIKRSRADWLKEYREPEKAEAFQQFCDEWWIVAGDAKIVQPDELPENWGLLVAHGARLICQKQAPKLTPVPLDRGILAAMLKRAIDQERGPIKQARDEGFADGQEYQREREEEVRKNGRDDLSVLRKQVYEFERASGIQIAHGWDAAKLGEAARVVLNGGHKHYGQRLQTLLQQLTDLTAQVERAHRAVAE